MDKILIRKAEGRIHPSEIVSRDDLKDEYKDQRFIDLFNYRGFLEGYPLGKAYIDTRARGSKEDREFVKLHKILGKEYPELFGLYENEMLEIIANPINQETDDITEANKININKQAQQPWIDGAQYVTSIEVDNEDVTYVWRGGSIVNVYNTKGEKIDFFPVGDESSEQEPTQPEIEAAITEHMDELMGMATNASLNKKADYEDNIINFVRDYFNPNPEQEESLEMLGEGENERLDFYDEIEKIIRNNPQEYSYGEEGSWEEQAKENNMDVDELIFETVDDELNTTYSLQYENLPDDEIGRLIKQKLEKINTIGEGGE